MTSPLWRATDSYWQWRRRLNCGDAGQGQSIVESLVTTWLSPRSQARPLKRLVERWITALGAESWWEWHAAGFCHLELSRPVRLGSLVRLLPSQKVDIPQPERQEDAVEWGFSPNPPKTWAVLRERVMNRRPDSAIRIYPFPAALTDTLALVASPLVEVDADVNWDGPFPAKPPSFWPRESLRIPDLEGTVQMDRKRETELRALYHHFEKRRGNDFWRGLGSLPANADRIQTALVYLQEAAREPNVFESHVSLATCLEALVGPKDQQDISRRVSSRVGLLAGVADEDAGDVFEHVRGLYDLRSRILHSSYRYCARPRRNQDPKRDDARDEEPAGSFRRERLLRTPVRFFGGRSSRGVATLRVELKRGVPFDPERLDRAEIDRKARRALGELAGYGREVPIREWVNVAVASDYVRPWSLDLDTP